MLTTFQSDAVDQDIRSAVKSVINTQRLFTADEVVAEMDLAQGHEELSRLGPILQDFKARKLIEPTGQFVRSTRPSTHSRPIPVWQSLAYRAGR